MVDALAREFAELTRQQKEILSRTAGLTVGGLRFRAAAGDWSTLEVLDHLVRVEEATGPTLRKHFAGTRQVSLRERLGAVGVLAVMRTPIRVKVPQAAKAMLPVEPEGLEVVAARWAVAREELRDTLEGVRVEQMELGVFQHPVCGWMRVGDALRFLSAHLDHHGYQLRRLERAIATNVV